MEMLAPPSWFDFSAECIYTAQKHKKSKSWLDGFCTCCFVRGWIVLKLFPEGASTANEPLEVWRLPPNAPEAVAQQEVELDLHLVQLLGNPQPLNGQRKLQLHHQPQPQPQLNSLQVQEKAIGHQPQSATSLDRGKVLPKRRLAGGLPRPKGVSPQGFRRPAAVPPYREAPYQNESGDNSMVSVQPPCLRSTGSFAAFVPPLLRIAEEPSNAVEELPFEKAWALNGAKALLSSICLCCGDSQACCCSDPCMGAGSGVADFFRDLFNRVQSGALLQRQHHSLELLEAEALPPKIQGSCMPTDEGDDSGGRQQPGTEPWAAVDGFPSAAVAPSQPEGQPLEANSKAPMLCGAPPAVAAAARTSVQGEQSHPPLQGPRDSSSATISCTKGAFYPAGSGPGPPRNIEKRSRFFALAEGCLPPAHNGAQSALYCSGQSSASGLADRNNAEGQGAALVKAFSKPAGPAPSMLHSEAAGGRNCTGRMAMKPELQHQHQLQTQQREPWQHGKLQQLSSEAGGAVRDPQPQAPPLLLAEGLPEEQVENLVDFVPVTFCTAPTESPPFNAAYAAAGDLFLSESLQGKGLRANQLALRYFNSILFSLQAALTETAQNIKWSNGCSPGMGEARFHLEGACIRLDGKHHSGFHQRVAEAHRQRKAKQQQLRRSRQLRQRKKRRIDSGKTASSESDADSQEDSSAASESESDVPRQPGLLLDLSKASILAGPPTHGLEGPTSQKVAAIPFAKAAAVKEQLGRNDIWALSTDGHFEDWSKLVLARSMWRGASPHTSCVKVSVLGPWPAVLSPVRIPLICFGANGQFTRASLPPPPPLLLHIRQMLQGRCRAIGGVKAVWVGRLHDELASIEACQRLFKAEVALDKLTVGPELNLKSLDAALEIGKACVARLIGLGHHGGGVNKCLEAEKTIKQLIKLDVSSEDAEAMVCKCSNGGGSWILNEEQQRVLIAISRWFGYTDGRRPFGPREDVQLHEKKDEEDTEKCINKSDAARNSQELQHGEVSIFSQNRQPSPLLQSNSQVNISEKEEKGADASNSSVGVQGCIVGSGPMVSPSDDDIADINLYDEDLDEMQLQEEVCPEANANRTEDRHTAADSAIPLGLPSKTAEGPSSQGRCTLATAHDSPAAVNKEEIYRNTPLQDDNSRGSVNVAEEQMKVQQRAQQPPPTQTGAPIPQEPAAAAAAAAAVAAFASSLASTAASMHASSAPIFLVQGVFGAGKTTLLAASLALLCRLLDLAKSRSRVLLVCATNAAVDGVLLRLMQQYDCCDFARIGRLSEMQPALLPHAVCSSAARTTAVYEFKTVLSGLLAASGAGARPHLACMARDLLQNIDKGSFPPSMQQWKRRRIWATTCSSFASSDLFSDGSYRGAASEGTSGSFFPFLLMDEASQVAEPLASAVLTRAHPLRCIFLGDTRQLPPTTRLRGPVAATASSLFSRLLHRAAAPAAAAEAQNIPVHREDNAISETCQRNEVSGGDRCFFNVFQMRLQYRCHPDLGRLAAEMFYGPFVAHGVTAAQRRPLLPEWRGALCLAVVRGSRETKAGRSLINAQEAAVVARLVHHALHSMHAAALGSSAGQAGVHGQALQPRPEDLGVICFYRAQADEVRRQLLRVLPKPVVDSVKVSTVDAFQGSEKELIFLSLVRSHAHIHGAGAAQQQPLRGSSTVDFLTCPHRVCVALTRAKRQLVIVAADTFLKQQGSLWSRICSRATQLPI